MAAARAAAVVVEAAGGRAARACAACVREERGHEVSANVYCRSSIVWGSCSGFYCHSVDSMWCIQGGYFHSRF